MPDRSVPAFSPAVLQYIRAVGDGLLSLDKTQLGELPSDLAQDLIAQHEAADGATAMGRLLGKRVQDARSKVDMKRVLEYFASGVLDAESPLLDNALDRPLPSYFINTSHNTYLTGNQLYGTASTEAYKDVLRRGCRSIEIDVWDGKSNSSDRVEKVEREAQDIVEGIADKIADDLNLQNEPRVLHGHTLTKEIPFRAVCEAIGEAAFVNSDMPVVVSLEVHCHAAQQEMMVQIMKQSWQQMLIEPPSEACTAMPNPSALRRKILVKVKGKALGRPEEVLPALAKVKTGESVSSEDEDVPKKDRDRKPTASKIVDSLSSLGIYTRAYHFKSFDSPEAGLLTHVFSLSERKVMTVHETENSALFQHNRRFLMRAFPAGTRVTSTNLDPAIFWRKGIQMVALNWQKFDAGIMQNYAMFSGSNGWVLKPEGYRASESGEDGGKSNTPSSSGAGEIAVRRYTLDLGIEILAAQQFPSAKHPYLKCELHVETPQERRGEKIENGGRSKEGEFKIRTKVPKNLDFAGAKLDFQSIQEVIPALSFIRFKLMDDVLGPDELLVWGCVRLDRLRVGIRFLHLQDAHGNDTDAVLLLNTRMSFSGA